MSDVLDITEQLQKMADLSTDVDVINTGLKAIDEIERQAETIEKLRAALKPFVKENYFTTEIYKDRDEQKSLWRMVVTKKELDAAAAAIRSDGDE